MKNPKRILVVRDDRLGDVILATPVFRALKETFPSCYVAVLAKPHTSKILEGNPYIDEIIIDDRDNIHSGFKGFLRLAFKIRKKRFDTALILWPTRRNVKLMFFGGVRRKINFGRKLYQLLFCDGIYMRERNYVHEPEVENNLDVARIIGADTKNKELVIVLNDKEKKWADEFFKSHEIKESDFVVIMHPGTGGTVSNCSAKQYADLCNEMKNKYNVKIILTIGDKEKDIIREMGKYLNIKDIIIFDSMDLRQLSALISKSKLFISCSTGPMHIASAFKIPVICFFPPLSGNNSKRWGPWMTSHIIIQAPVDLICDSCKKEACRFYNCMDLIDMSDVSKKAGDFINSKIDL